MMTDEEVIKLIMWITGNSEETVKELINTYNKYHNS